MAAPDIIIIVRQLFRLAEVQPLRSALLEGGATVWTILVGLNFTSACEMKIIEENLFISGMRHCKTVSPLLAARFGVELVSRQELADHIGNADLVIPC